MTQYVLQILDENQQLIKCYEVTEDTPIRETVPEGRTQCIITNTEEYQGAVGAYEEYGLRAKYSWDGTDITWIID